MIFCLNIKSKNAFTVYRFIAEMDEPVDKNCQKNIKPFPFLILQIKQFMG